MFRPKKVNFETVRSKLVFFTRNYQKTTIIVHQGTMHIHIYEPHGNSQVFISICVLFNWNFTRGIKYNETSRQKSFGRNYAHNCVVNSQFTSSGSVRHHLHAWTFNWMFWYWYWYWDWNKGSSIRTFNIKHLQASMYCQTPSARLNIQQWNILSLNIVEYNMMRVTIKVAAY